MAGEAIGDSHRPAGREQTWMLAFPGSPIGRDRENSPCGCLVEGKAAPGKADDGTHLFGRDGRDALRIMG